MKFVNEDQRKTYSWIHYDEEKMGQNGIILK